MKGLARIAITRPVAVIITAITFVVLGIASKGELPLDLFPDLRLPTIYVAVESADRPAEEMEQLYGRKIEQRLFTVRGLKSMEQTARTGKIVARVSFNWQTDVDLALLDVTRAVVSLEADSRVDAVKVRRYDPSQLPIVVLGLTQVSGQNNLAELRRLAQRRIATNLEQLDGVAEVRISGGRIKEIEVKLDVNRMRAYGITVNKVRQRIDESNWNYNLGTLRDAKQILQVRALSQFSSLQDLRQVVIDYIASEEGILSAVTLADIADISENDAPVNHVVRVDGFEGIGVSIYKEAESNTVAVSEVIRGVLDKIEEDLPGVSVTLITDEAALVKDAITDVEHSVLLGIILAIGVLTLFLRSYGPIVIVAVAVPVSLLTTLFAMDLFGQSLNLVTLAGLALGAGMLVDNAIVVVESIFRCRTQGEAPVEAAVNGTAKVVNAIVASTLTTCVVFLPVLFIDKLAARLVSGLSFTVVVSLLVSLAVATLLVPALCVWMLPGSKNSSIDPGSKKLENTVLALLNRPWTVIAAASIFISAAILGLQQLGTELLPASDPRQVSLRLITPPGQQVEATEKVVESIEMILKRAAENDYAAMISEVGKQGDDERQTGVQESGENTAQLRMRLQSGGLSAGQIVKRSEQAIASLYGAEIHWNINESPLDKALGSQNAAITIEITGHSLQDLQTSAELIQAKMATLPSLWNVKASYEGAPKEVRLTLDRAVANAMDVDIDTISSVLKASLNGLQATHFVLGDEDREVLVRLPQVDLESILNIPFQTLSGKILTIGSVTKFELTPGAREIFRRDQRRISKVTAAVSPGTALPEARQYVEQMLKTTVLPWGIKAALAGEEQERVETLNELSWAAILAMLLVLMVLAGSFESLLHPLTILTAIPLALVGVAIFLMPLGQPIGIMAMLGLIVLVGVAVNDAILLVQMTRQLILQGMETRQALAKAVALRLRPILMTSATTILALLPLAMGSGDAAPLRVPLAFTVIGGMLTSTLGCLFVIPAVYLVLDNLGAALRPAKDTV